MNTRHQPTYESPSRIAIRRFRKNPPAMAGLLFICLLVIVWMLGALIRPDQTINANDQHLELSRQKPGFTVQFLKIKQQNIDKAGFFEMWIDGGKNNDYREIPISTYAIGDTTIEITTYHPNNTSAGEKIHFTAEEIGVSSLQNVDEYIHSTTYLLGTDKYGRDLLSRLMAGTSISLSVGAIAVIISLLVGLTLGLIAGYYRGWVDQVIMWFTNVIWAIPTLLLVMAITFAFGTGFWKVFLAVGLTMWVEVARIARGQVLSIREKEFVEAAKALGYSQPRITFKHILPNILSPIIVISAANFASAILIEAGLSFLGLGAQIPTPSWGNMIREHYAFITTDLAYLAIIPGVLIMMLVLSFMLVGNGLRDALDVRE